MHKEYVIIGDDACVTNEHGEMKKFTVSVINSLENENGIDFLNNLITTYEKKIKSFNEENKMRRKNSIKLVVFLFIFVIILELFANPTFSLFIPFFLAGCGILCINVANTVVINKNNEVLSFKLKHIREEKRKLELKQNNQINKKVLDEGIIKKIDNSDQINSLKRELELIEQYKTNKSKYVTYYKNNCLNIYMGYLGYHGESIDFVVSLIEQDLGIKQKQKILSNKYRSD